MKDHKYFVYIVCSRSGTLYIGMTNSIYRRSLEHKRGEIEGFAAKYHCDRLVYYESFDDVHKAIGREKQLKGWSRAKKIALIESKNPRWEDMAEKWGAKMAFAGEPIKRPMNPPPVILSGADEARSDSSAQSKDPLAACAKMSVKRSSHGADSAERTPRHASSNSKRTRGPSTP